MNRRCSLFLILVVGMGMGAVVPADPPVVIEPNWKIRFQQDIGQNAYAFVPGVDIDKDGFREFVAIGRNPQQDTIYIFESTGNDSYSQVWAAPRLGDDVLERGPLAVGDSDGDGYLEIVVGDSGKTNDYDLVLVYEFDPALAGGQIAGGQNPPPEPSTVLKLGLLGEATTDTRPSAIQVADWDQDGKNEIIVGTVNAEDRSLVIYESTGGNAYADPIIIPVENGISALSPVADIDGDGDLELVVLALNQIVLVMSWDGVGEPEIESYLTFDPTATNSTQGWIALGDLDGNGTLEIIVSDAGIYTVRVYEAIGPDTYATDEEGGVFATGDRPDTLIYAKIPGQKGGSIIWGYDLGDKEEIFIADHIGPEGSFTTADFTPMRVLVDIPEEPEALAFFGEPGTLDGDGYVDLIFGMRSASAEEGEGDEEIYVVEYTGASLDTAVDSWILH